MKEYVSKTKILSYPLKTSQIMTEAKLDGIYVFVKLCHVLIKNVYKKNLTQRTFMMH